MPMIDLTKARKTAEKLIAKHNAEELALIANIILNSEPIKFQKQQQWNFYQSEIKTKRTDDARGD